MKQNIKFEFKPEGDTVKVSICGQLDTPATEEIQAKVEELLEYASRTIVIDCSALEYIASSGLRQLILIYKRCKAQGGHLTLTGVTSDVMEIFHATTFDSVFDIQ